MKRLTGKQAAFAKLVANGMTKTDAYNQVYSKANGNDNVNSRTRQAYDVSVIPHVQAAIDTYQNQSLPIADMRVCREQMLSNMRWLATESPDHRVRLAATKMLHDIADERIARDESHARTQSVAVEQLLSELSDLRQSRALPATLDIEAVSTDDPDQAPQSDSE